MGNEGGGSHHQNKKKNVFVAGCLYNNVLRVPRNEKKHSQKNTLKIVK